MNSQPPRPVDRVRQIYEDTGRDAAALLWGAAAWFGGFLIALLWSVLAALVLGWILGDAGYALGFFGVWIAVYAPRFGQFCLGLVLSAVPAFFMALVPCIFMGGSLVGWWMVLTVAVVIVQWARTVTAPPAVPAQPLPHLHGHSAPSEGQELDALEYLE
jgi:ABC-type microcin C transport system permease subunit YejE